MDKWSQLSQQDWYNLAASQWVTTSDETTPVDLLKLVSTPQAPDRLVLNFTPPEFQLKVGNVDFTPFVEHLTLERPRAEITTPYWWTGSLVLAHPIERSLLPESLDDLENPGRWARGAYPVRIFFKKILFATVRITEYFYDEDTYKAEAKLGDILNLLDFKAPPKDYKGLGFEPCSRITVNTVVNKLLQEAGVFNFAVNAPGVLEVPPNKPSGSYIKYAQQLLGERGYWLYVDQQEIVQCVSLFGGSAKPLLSCSRAEVDVYQRQRSPELPADKIIVTGSVEKFADCETDNPQIIEEYTTIQGKDGQKYYALQRRETIWLIQEAFNKTGAIGNENIQIRKIQVEQARGAAFPAKSESADQQQDPDQFFITSDPGGTAIITTEVSVEKKTFDSQGRLRRKDTLSNKLLGVVLPEEFPASEIMVTGAERELEEYFEDPPNGILQEVPGATPVGRGDGVLRGKRRTFWTLFPIGTDSQYLQDLDGPSKIEVGGIAYINAIKEQIIERWTDGTQTRLYPIGSALPPVEKCNCQRYAYRKLVYQRIGTEVSSKERGYADDRPYHQLGVLAINSSLSKSSEDSIPPNWEMAKPRCGTCTVTVKGERIFGSAYYTPYKQREYEYQASTVQSSIEAGQLAGVIGVLQHGRYRERLISCPLPNEYLNNPDPFQVANIGKGAYILDSPSLVLAEDGLEVSWKGIYQGVIPEIPPPPDEIMPANFFTESEKPELQILPLTPKKYFIGQDIVTLVQAYGGVPPYTLSAQSLPPGFLVSGGFIAGKAATTGVFSIEIKVRDSKNNTKTTVWEVVVVSVPIPVSPVSEIIPIYAAHGHSASVFRQDEEDIKFPTPKPISAIHLHSGTVLVSIVPKPIKLLHKHNLIITPKPLVHSIFHFQTISQGNPTPKA